MGVTSYGEAIQVYITPKTWQMIKSMPLHNLAQVRHLCFTIEWHPPGTYLEDLHHFIRVDLAASSNGKAYKLDVAITPWEGNFSANSRFGGIRRESQG